VVQKLHVFWQFVRIYVLKLISLQSCLISLHPELISLQPVPLEQRPHVPVQYCDITEFQLGSLQYRVFAVQFIGDNESSPHVYAAVSQHAKQVLAHSNAMLSKSGFSQFGARTGGTTAGSAIGKIALHSAESLISEQLVAFGPYTVGLTLQESAVIAAMENSRHIRIA
jgi:hypothetical protein